MELLYVFLIGVIVIFGTVSVMLLIRIIRKRRAANAAPQLIDETANMPLFTSDSIKESLNRSAVDESDRTVALFEHITQSSGGNYMPSEKTDIVGSVQLVLTDLARPHKHFTVAVHDTIEIGRSPNAPGIVIDYDKQISRRHCAVKLREHSLWIADLGASNRTKVNNNTLRDQYELRDGDELTLGRTKFSVRITRPR